MIKFIPGFATTNEVWEEQKDLNSPYLSMGNSIIAWSMGIFEAVRIYFNNPSDIKKMVLVSGTPRFLKDKNYQYGLSPALYRKLEKKLKADLNSGLKYFYSLILNGKEHPIFDKFGEFSSEGIFANLERLKREDIRKLLPYIDVPILLIHGSDDQICLPSASKYMAELIPKSRLVIMEGVAHAPFLEKPKQFNQLVKEFLKC